MMICPETYYDMYLKGKTVPEIKTAIRILKREMSHLINVMEHPNYQSMVKPSEDVRLSCSRDYLERAKQALADLGVQYTPTKAEKRAQVFEDNIPNIEKIEFSYGAFSYGAFLGHIKTRTYTISEKGLKIEEDGVPYIPPRQIDDEELTEMDKEDLFDILKELHIGEWRRHYDTSRFGIHVLDGFEWEIQIHYNNGKRPVKISGCNAYPYNFRRLTECLEIDDLMD